MMTVLWIVSVVFTLLSVDSCDDVATACYGSDNASDCIPNKLLETCLPMLNWLDSVNNMLFVNVSTVHHAVLPAS
jgi:hypothetical protein